MFQSFISTIFYLPLAWIGFHPVAFVTINAIQTLYQFWIHTRTIGKLPPVVELIFNTPSHHRVHHGRNPKYIDKNHGGTLIIFDRLFGTFQEEEEEVVYGVTKPLASWNPLWANVDYYAALWQEVRHTPDWGDKLRMLVRKPGWRPATQGGPVPIPEVDAAAEKFDTEIPLSLNYYVLAQFVLVLAFTSFYLFADPQPDAKGLAAATWIFGGIAGLGGVLEGKKWSLPLEVLRHISLPGLLLWFMPSSTTTWLAMIIALLLGLASVIWVWPQPKVAAAAAPDEM
ncbi:MAG: hypothetical protein OHK0039_24280 [Bacteroidia bacterium]